MDNINVLLVNGDRGINRLIEATVLDVCYNQALVHFTRTVELSEFVRLGPSEGFGVIIMVADHLVSTSKRHDSLIAFEEIVGAVQSVRSQRATPLIVISASDDNKDTLIEAGAECGIKFPLNRETLRSEVRRLLKVPELNSESTSPEWGQAGLWLRRLLGLRSA